MALAGHGWPWPAMAIAIAGPTEVPLEVQQEANAWISSLFGMDHTYLSFTLFVSADGRVIYSPLIFLAPSIYSGASFP